jgi:hypothetical protein
MLITNLSYDLSAPKRYYLSIEAICEDYDEVKEMMISMKANDFDFRLLPIKDKVIDNKDKVIDNQESKNEEQTKNKLLEFFEL